MPIGSYAAIPVLAAELLAARPASVLDLGIGFGMAGAVVRQWLDAGARPFNTYLAGVEVWPDYRSPLWDLYDLVSIGLIEQQLSAEDMLFDMIIMGDVLEHFEFACGEEVLRGAQRRLAPDGRLFVSTPALPMPQGMAHGNPYEQHRSGWTAADLARRGFEILLSESDPQLPPAVPTLVARWISPSMRTQRLP